MTAKRFVLVTGATGLQGRAVANALLDRGHKIRGLTRDIGSAAAKAFSARGVEMVRGDFDDPASLVAAARGVDSVFVMATPFAKGPAKETADGIAAVDAAKAAGVGHVIYSSVGGAHQKTGIPHFDSKRRVEEHLEASGVPYTIIGPVYFMDNVFLPWMTGGLAAGALAQALTPDRQLQQVAVADIGKLVALLVERREAVFGRRFDIASDAVTGPETARILSEAIGRPISYVAQPLEPLKAFSEDTWRMMDWFQRVGYSADIPGLRAEFQEVGWQTLRQWAATQDWSGLRAAYDKHAADAASKVA